MKLRKAITVARSWIETPPTSAPADAAVSTATLRALAAAARRAIPPTDLRATREKAKRGLRAVATIERHIEAVEARPADER